MTAFAHRTQYEYGETEIDAEKHWRKGVVFRLVQTSRYWCYTRTHAHDAFPQSAHCLCVCVFVRTNFMFYHFLAQFVGTTMQRGSSSLCAVVWCHRRRILNLPICFRVHDASASVWIKATSYMHSSSLALYIYNSVAWLKFDKRKHFWNWTFMFSTIWGHSTVHPLKINKFKLQYLEINC